MVPFRHYGDLPVLTVTATHCLSLQYKDLCNCRVVVVLFAVLLLQDSLNRNVEKLPCELKIKLLCFGFFFSCLVMMGELRFHFQFDWFRPFKAQAFLLAKERHQLEM